MLAKSMPAGVELSPYGRPEADREQINVLELLHRYLRGRYVLALSLAIVGATCGLAAGWLIPRPKFRSEGLIRIQPVMPRILYPSEESTLQPMFASFVNTQANLIQNDRVLSKAMNSAAWRALARGRSPEEESSFRKSLSVRTSRDSPELIFVSFSDVEAKASLVAVQEIITAYKELFVGGETKDVRDMQVSALTSRRQTLESERRDLEKQINAVSAEFESGDLARLSEHYLSQLIAYDERASQLGLALAEAGIDPAAAPDEAAAAQDPLRLKTPEEIAAVDKSMAEYLERRQVVQRYIDHLRTTGFTDLHRSVKAAVKELEGLEKAIKERCENWEPPAEAAMSVQDATPAQLVARYHGLRQQAEAWRVRSEAVSKARLEIESFRSDVKKKQEALDEVNRRLDQIGLESKVQDAVGRIEVIEPEGAPSTPTDDPRKKLAVLGMLLGGGAPIALVLLFGVVDRRFRFADEAGKGPDAVPLLGVLPELEVSAEDPEQMAGAVHSIHHIRTHVQLAAAGHKVYAITSPTAGDGKTSLSLSLAISFTSSGAKTLLIDFDLVGHALSTRLGMPCEHGVGRYLATPGSPSPLVPTAFPRISLIPAGAEDVRYHSRVTREAFAAMLANLRTEFDAIIIDTGPILGSLEANIASTVADSVILVVGRGQHRSRLREAIDQLVRLRAHIAGMVFNRAYSTDFNRSSVASTSVRSVGKANGLATHRPNAGNSPNIGNLDPLARHMAMDAQDDEKPA